MKRFSQRQGYGSLAELNITPLLDLAFVLLIIFMITAPALEQMLPLTPPEMESTPRALGRESIRLIEIDNQGQIFWEGEMTNLEKLEEFIKQEAGQEKQRPIGIRADGKLAYQKVVDIVEILEKHQVKRFGLLTRVQGN
jgi:biopolymer transport protein ExbD